MRQFKRLLLVALITLCAASAEAKIISIGVLGGSTTTFYNAKNYNSDAIENTTGFHAGVSASISLPFLSVTPEVIYTHSQFDIVDSSILTSTSEVKVNAIDIPLVVGLSIIGPVKLELGPSFSIYDSAKGTYYPEIHDDLDFGRVHSEVGYIVGLKATLFGKITLGARFNGQFGSQTTSVNIGSETKSFDLGYRAIAFSAGWRF